MKTTILYFSSTGNSLAIAKSLADELNNAQIKSIKNLLNSGNFIIDSEVIGIVTPVYCKDTPNIVKELLKKLELKNAQYIFAIATNNGEAGYTLGSINEILELKGKKLDIGYTILMPGNSLVVLDKTNPEPVRNKRILNSKQRIKEIAHEVKKQKTGAIEGEFGYIHNVIASIYKFMVYQLLRVEKRFKTTDKCVKCGICQKICPRFNIEMTTTGPKWNSNCEACLACYHWCPSKSIEIANSTKNKLRYHHPEITLQQLL